MTDRIDAAVDAPRIVIHVGGVEAFDTVATLLRRAGAFGLGSRRFEVRPPLAAGQVEALEELDGFQDGRVTVTVDSASGDIWHADPSVAEPVLQGSNQAWWERNRRPSKAGSVTVRAGIEVPLGENVPFTVNVAHPDGNHAVSYRFDGQLCAVTVNGSVTVAGSAFKADAVFRATDIASDGAWTEVELRATGA